MFCPKCGKELSSNKCNNCGTVIDEHENNVSLKENEASKLLKSANHYLFAIILIFVFNLYVYIFNFQHCEREKIVQECGLGGLCPKVTTNNIVCTPYSRKFLPTSLFIIIILAILYFSKKIKYHKLNKPNKK